MLVLNDGLVGYWSFPGKLRGVDQTVALDSGLG